MFVIDLLGSWVAIVAGWCIHRHIWIFPCKSEVEDFWISPVQFNSITAVHSNPRKFQHAYVLFTFEKMSVTCSIHPTDFSYVFIVNHWIAGVVWLEYYISWYRISLSLGQIPSYQIKNKNLNCPLCLLLLSVLDWFWQGMFLTLDSYLFLNVQ